MRLFSKGVPGLDNKDCPMAWRTLGFVTCQIGPLQVVTKLYHLHAFLSLVCFKHLGAKDNSFQYKFYSNYSFFAEIITQYSTGWYIIFICKIFVLFFVLNVKNDRLDATLIIIIIFLADTGVILTLTSGNVTWFYDRNFDFILKILWR